MDIEIICQILPYMMIKIWKEEPCSCLHAADSYKISEVISLQFDQKLY